MFAQYIFFTTARGLFQTNYNRSCLDLSCRGSRKFEFQLFFSFFSDWMTAISNTVSLFLILPGMSFDNVEF